MISIDGEKSCDKNPNLFLIKTSSKVEIYGNFFTLIKSSYQKNLQLIFRHNGIRQNAFVLRSGTRQRRSFSPFLFSLVSEALASAIRQEKEIRYIQIREEKKRCLYLQKTWLSDKSYRKRN